MCHGSARLLTLTYDADRSLVECWRPVLLWQTSRRQMRNLTAFEKKTGWRYSVTCTNIPDDGIPGVPGSHHPQFIDVLHREHACVETAGVRTAKAMGLRGLPSKTWQVNCAWVIAANIAADLAAWTRLLGLHDDGELRDANPDTLRYRIWHLPARLARHARQRTLAISAAVITGVAVPERESWAGVGGGYVRLGAFAARRQGNGASATVAGR